MPCDVIDKGNHVLHQEYIWDDLSKTTRGFENQVGDLIFYEVVTKWIYNDPFKTRLSAMES